MGAPRVQANERSCDRPAGPANTPAARTVDDAALRGAGGDNSGWFTYGRDYEETRFSPLDQINVDTVDRLGVVWHYDTGSYRGLEATPLVADARLVPVT